MGFLSEFSYNPSHLPSLVYRERSISYSYQHKDRLPTVPAFYHVRDLKGDKNYEMKKVVFTRLTGALFVEKSCITFYNLGNEIVNVQGCFFNCTVLRVYQIKFSQINGCHSFLTNK